MAQRTYPTGPGWWPLLDEFEKQAKSLDPEVKLMYKEKYGTVQIDYSTECTGAFNELFKLTDVAEDKSKTVCEFCGQSGQLREQKGWLTTLCDRCAALDPLERRKIAAETAERYFSDREDAEDYELAMERLQNNTGRLITHKELTEKSGIKQDDIAVHDVEFED